MISKNAIVHGIVGAVLMVAAFLISKGGDWQTLTLGGLANIAYHWLLNWYNNTTITGSSKL